MSDMKYEVGDKVRIKNLDSLAYAGRIMTIGIVRKDFYILKEDKEGHRWTDEMIECKVEEENTDCENCGLTRNSIRCLFMDNCPHNKQKNIIEIPEGYVLKDENGKEILTSKIILEKLEPKYPKTYEECCKVLGCKANHFFTDFSYNGLDIEISDYENKIDDLLQTFRKLRYCRDAYWKIAGEEMGLDGPWEPTMETVYCISRNNNVMKCSYRGGKSNILEFPTPEMRDAFKENFDPDIEICKEFL